MTKKDFELIASIIAKLPDKAERVRLAIFFSWHLHEINPQFNEGLFLQACDAIG